MKLTIYGKKEIFKICITGILLVCISIWLVIYIAPFTGLILTLITILIFSGLLAFFRDPIRVIPSENNLLVSPADGVVRDIEVLTNSEENCFLNCENIIRVGIFLSVLDVHINRAPCDIEVEKCMYRKGKYHDARNPLASKENEAMTIFCTASVKGRKFPLIVRQISGAIARRIVCVADRGAKIEKGVKFGMIKFGSRTELFLPGKEFVKIKVKNGDRVFAGETIIAEICNSEH